MMTAAGVAPPAVPTAPSIRGEALGGVPETLLNLYARYRTHEAAGLLALLPEGGVRSLHREVERRRAEGAFSSEVDTFSALHLLAEELLPLPNYAEWVADYLTHREAYLLHLGVSSAPESSEPVTIGLRPFGHDWFASLAVFRGSNGWRGFLQFHRDGELRGWRTADVFREEEVDLIRERFQALSPDSLQAFLRSVFP